MEIICLINFDGGEQPHAGDRRRLPIFLPYGGSHVELNVPFPSPPDIIRYDSEASAPSERILREALRRPVAGKPLQELAIGRSDAVIVISDSSRLVPSHLFLPLLLEELNRGGIPDERIRIVVALGMHRKHTEAELRQLAGTNVYDRVAVVNHSPLPEHCILLGQTSRGTPVEINRIVAEADLLVVTGNIEPHRLVGVSGGVKSIMPGTASQRCIESNHALSQRFKAVPGDPNNPIHRDLEEVLRFVRIDFALNVIANHRREVLEAYAGDVHEVHRQGVEAAAKRFFVPVNRKYDLVIASAGGHPKDAQLYQAVKTLQNAAAFAAPAAPIVLVARCEEMFGNGLFQYWVETVTDRAAIVRKLSERFVLGAHKISHLDEVLREHPVYIHCDMPEPLTELAGFRSARDLNATVTGIVGQGIRHVAVMPYGSLTFPRPEQSDQAPTYSF